MIEFIQQAEKRQLNIGQNAKHYIAFAMNLIARVI